MHALLSLALSAAAAEALPAEPLTLSALAALTAHEAEQRTSYESTFEVAEPPRPKSGPELAWAKNHLTVLLFNRWLDDSGWEPVDNPLGVALGYAGRTGEWFHWDFALSWSEDDTRRDVGGTSTKLEIDTWEFSFGILKIFDTSRIHPYFGLGAAWSYVDGRVASASQVSSDNDSSLGGYLRAGLLYPVKNGYVGFDFRAMSLADVDIGGRRLDLDYTQLGLIFGYGF